MNIHGIKQVLLILLISASSVKVILNESMLLVEGCRLVCQKFINLIIEHIESILEISQGIRLCLLNICDLSIKNALLRIEVGSDISHMLIMDSQ